MTPLFPLPIYISIHGDLDFKITAGGAHKHSNREHAFRRFDLLFDGIVYCDAIRHNTASQPIVTCARPLGEFASPFTTDL